MYPSIDPDGYFFSISPFTLVASFDLRRFCDAVLAIRETMLVLFFASSL